jgi:histidinol-phosphate aminotransferase
MSVLDLVRADWDTLEPYVPVKPLDVLAAEIGLPVERLVKLDANENLYGTHPAVLDAVSRAGLHIYPDPGQSALRDAIAGYVGHGVRPEQVVAGQGADDLIDLVFRLFMPRAIVDCPPTFGMYRFLAHINQAEVVDAWRGEGFALDLTAIERAVEGGATVVFLTSPNNPTGNPLRPAELERLLTLPAVIAVDEAYVEFAGGTCAGLLAAHDNLVILRTFSKWAGLAGLRVGYALCAEPVAERLMAIKQPYNVNVAADVAARAAIAHRAEIAETIAQIIAERERMSAAVASLGWLRPWPSQANFVLFDVLRGEAASTAAALRARGVLVRYYDRPGLRNCIRISAGRPEDTDRLLAALKEVAP